jgi:predicted carbohydrate-binding protein with CBM5 and CBM33 domain
MVTALRLLAALALLGSAAAHGYLSMPPTRGAVPGGAVNYCVHCSNAGGARAILAAAGTTTWTSMSDKLARGAGGLQTSVFKD